MRHFLICLALFWGTALHAEGFFSLGSQNDDRKWEAVGRLEIAGDAFCTGALIAPDLVLTAAHCLFDPVTGVRVPTDDIQFLAGWRNGRAAAYRRVRQAVHLPDYDFSSPADTARVRKDLALLELQHPIRNTTIEPFLTQSRPDKGAEVGVVSYAYNRSEAPSLQELCSVLSRQDGILVLSCAVEFGASGSPVFSFGEDGTPRVVSVVSAKARDEGTGEAVSLAVSLDSPLSVLRALVADGAGLPRGLIRQTAGTRNDATGAKFIRP
ncbi:trypsin-like serine peptidase [Primorskyibacter sp. 2E107]|uniref:trypsin-like serine peptidase n=1 Tax=Primorskyibacter sp. 2E107 TaxID=3403458 RepID=UPI003AF4DD01